MRGLTPNERAWLADCAGPLDFSETDEAGDADWYVLTPLMVSQGRLMIRGDLHPDRDYAIATDLGSLALRCCPLEEA